MRLLSWSMPSVVEVDAYQSRSADLYELRSEWNKLLAGPPYLFSTRYIGCRTTRNLHVA